MTRMVIRARCLLTPLEEIPDGIVLAEDGRIVAAGRREEIAVPHGARDYDASRWTLAPGLIDIHIHGAGGRDVMEADADAIGQITPTVARYGTTAMLATTVTASADDTLRSLERIARWAGNQGAGKPAPAPAAEVLGIHFEGPFISPVRRGVHPPGWIAKPSTALLDQMAGAAAGWGRILTLAPEAEGALDLVKHGRNAGLVVAMGHTNATFEEATAGIEAGARHATHTFNAMRPFSHRDPGVIGAVLTRNDVTAEVIADGVHVDAAALRILLATKGIEGTILVSDGTAATAMPDGAYRVGTAEMRVSGGVCRDGEGRLAGSTLTLDRAVRHMVSLGVALKHAVRMATFNPARRLGIEGRKGILAAGADADLIFLDENLRVAAVMTRHMDEPQRLD